MNLYVKRCVDNSVSGQLFGKLNRNVRSYTSIKVAEVVLERSEATLGNLVSLEQDIERLVAERLWKAGTERLACSGKEKSVVVEESSLLKHT